MSGYISSSGPTGAQTPSTAASVVSALSTAFSSGQKAVTNSATALGTTTAFKNGFALSNLSTSTTSVFVGIAGVTTSTGYELVAGQSIVIPMQDISAIYVVAASNGTSTVSWIGFN